MAQMQGQTVRRESDEDVFRKLQTIQNKAQGIQNFAASVGSTMRGAATYSNAGRIG